MSYIHADPTANTAIARVDREIRAREKRREAAERAAREAERLAAEPAGKQVPRSRSGWTLVWTAGQGRL